MYVDVLDNTLLESKQICVMVASSNMHRCGTWRWNEIKATTLICRTQTDNNLANVMWFVYIYSRCISSAINTYNRTAMVKLPYFYTKIGHPILIFWSQNHWKKLKIEHPFESEAMALKSGRMCFQLTAHTIYWCHTIISGALYIDLINLVSVWPVGEFHSTKASTMLNICVYNTEKICFPQSISIIFNRLNGVRLKPNESRQPFNKLAETFLCEPLVWHISMWIALDENL